jgi:hypothetical protein
MNRKLKIFILILVILISGLLFFGYEVSYAPESNLPKNEITFTSQTTLDQKENVEIIKSVDDFMNEYKLPKGVDNFYEISVEKRAADSIEIFVTFGEENNKESAIIYAEKTNGVWNVDPNAGPWCTLETFANKTCY